MDYKLHSYTSEVSTQKGCTVHSLDVSSVCVKHQQPP